MNTATVRREIETFMARNPGRAGMGASMLRILDAGERDRRNIATLRAERDDALALAERLAGERDRLRDWLNIAKQFVWDEEIVENIDAELAAAPPPASEDAGGAR